MTIAIDTTVSLSTSQINALLSNNVSCVLRYVAPQSWKRITPEEYKRIVATRMQVVLNWESSANDFSNPNTNWLAFTHEAVRQAELCGYPHGSVIYFSADENISSSARPTFERAVRTIMANLGPYQFGLYGPWDALEWAKALGAKYFWQCMSASYSEWHNAHQWPGVHIWQRHGTSIAGISCDTNDIIQANFGQANATTFGDSMLLLAKLDDAHYYVCDGVTSRPIAYSSINSFLYLYRSQCMSGTAGPEWDNYNPYGAYVRKGWVEDVFGKLGTAVTLTEADIDTIATKVAAEINPGATVEEVTQAVKSVVNGTHLTTS